MKDKFICFKKNIEEKINLISDQNDSKKIILEIKYFLKTCTQELKQISDDNKKREFGKLLNNFKIECDDLVYDLNNRFKVKKYIRKNDFTVVKENIKYGSVHPLISLCKLMEKIFLRMGFSVVSGPEIELDKYNFEKLNMPSHHPARDMQDTFYISMPNVLLRSHTSSVQIRTMQSNDPPIRIISPGTVYRVDDIDPQHTPMFYQLEGLIVDKGISFSNLKSVLMNFLKNVFTEDIEVRFRPSYYPYTEPSAAVDISCPNCKGPKCRICGGANWITVLGSGMVHPDVLKGVGYDTEVYTGFAFGLGLNRLALIYYDLGEIKKIYENDISLWKQLN